MSGTQKGCEKGAKLSPQSIVNSTSSDSRSNVGLAPLLGAWLMDAVTGGFAVLNLRLLSVNPPGSTNRPVSSQICAAGNPPGYPRRDSRRRLAYHLPGLCRPVRESSPCISLIGA